MELDSAYISAMGFLKGFTLLSSSCPISELQNEDATSAFLPFLSLFCVVLGGRNPPFFDTLRKQTC